MISPVKEQSSRHYVDVGGRRIHYRRLGEGPPVVLLHASPRSSSAMLPLMTSAPHGVTVFAFDNPGFGLSDRVELSDAQALDFGADLDAALEALGIKQCPVYATHTGAAIAVGLALHAPHRVSRLVVDGLCAMTRAEAANTLANYLPTFNPVVDGQHLAWVWTRVRDQFLFYPWNQRGQGSRQPLSLHPTLDQVHAVVMDFLASGDNYRHAYSSAFTLDATAAVAQIQVPTVIGARDFDMLYPHLERLGKVRANIRIERFASAIDEWQRQIWAHLMQGLTTEAAPRSVNPPLGTARISRTYVDADGLRMHVRGAMNGQGRPLVLLHDCPGASAGLVRRLERVAGRRPVVALDLPGHGDSQCLDSLSDINAVLGFLNAGLRDLGIDQAEVAGEGLGAVLATKLASQWMTNYEVEQDTMVLNRRIAENASYDPQRLVPGSFAAEEAGAHVFRAWQQARDSVILGSWSSRRLDEFHPFGDALDAEAIHLRTIEILKESTSAVDFRRAVYQAAME
ncbi:alpha/beta fold hydrolase [Paraburkholderia phymatum]|uniref:alpha/beta fold hydrolase n=1 Tax=Paraburkholderia phymatum TaxID=148447 RepID=UPI00316B318A